MANEIDYVLDLDPEGLADKDLDVIIAYQRRMQANHEAGIKPQKEGAISGPELLSKLFPAKAPAPLKRRY